LHNMAHALLDWETIDKYQIDELMQGRAIAPPEPEIEPVTLSGDQPASDEDKAGEWDSDPKQPTPAVLI
ncbi:MAG: hypothetical protein ACXWEU_10345, partial [Methylomonas sp.]